MDPPRRQRGPDRGLPRALGQAEAVRAVGEHVHGVRDLVGGERRAEAVRVLGENIGVLGGCGARPTPGQACRGYLADIATPGLSIDLG